MGRSADGVMLHITKDQRVVYISWGSQGRLLGRGNTWAKTEA